ncbi:hypothetical protein A3A76_02055 [Candidatus Woesebacteria bacterium RIFCSPLOWO2_01_FULL_39_23]|uniref:Uncharacterized protein n=1 Tax=Candidatus Woesebacteria bacterium RIFCSPHIGHO2_01_FULL_40_22 TaxID=1802499 RepID=A0A1F7YFZ6_9BACT|nr:MAG: hypothetical protein A2141_03200 [Candidatus Woesebacteria bacterium RBG_16_40_11]OGM26182.1 MAG: hypothetical protein A2628_02485 [Candidatus Woesebacteria bacterium RIFCSPHIGHO2_01_FULL_40_22]OGM37969.1 MAG: hypothetical protein A3E41_03565 [Candidatus Woesebacteria bacterium RIFCSPHIGHO2_12_FULL_38_9]OGM62341.1 MAG: hypothetical protein A3A76_02055 [Candidatus Woesebacteria bacterium RIFCSPLOWO2_01_FULL_39_23]
MTRNKLNELLNKVEREVEEIKVRTEKVVGAANEIARSSYNSPSQSGDRYHSQSQADLAKSSLINMQDFQQMLKQSLERDLPESIAPICYVELIFNDGETSSFFYVEESPSVISFKFVSSSSPLGLAIIGKRISEEFELMLENKSRKGIISSIE